MKNVLIINGHQYIKDYAEGKLTQTILDKATAVLENKGFVIKHTAVDKGYDINEELEKFKWADYIIFQYPVFWMSVPWKTKKYIDEMFSSGAGSVTYASDGRSREDASKRYGSGGLMQGKKYMLSMTYNCPTSEFDNKEGFFEGLSRDEANFAVHKVFQFCGLEPLETYAMHDIFKGDLDVAGELSKLETILQKNFS